MTSVTSGFAVSRPTSVPLRISCLIINGILGGAGGSEGGERCQEMSLCAPCVHVAKSNSKLVLNVSNSLHQGDGGE